MGVHRGTLPGLSHTQPVTAALKAPGFAESGHSQNPEFLGLAEHSMYSFPLDPHKCSKVRGCLSPLYQLHTRSLARPLSCYISGNPFLAWMCRSLGRFRAKHGKVTADSKCPPWTPTSCWNSDFSHLTTRWHCITCISYCPTRPAGAQKEMTAQTASESLCAPQP